MANEKILQNIEGTDTIAGSWRRLLDRDRNVSNFFSGDDFTTDQKAEDVGRPNWRTDLNRLFIFDGTNFVKLWDYLTPEEIAYTVDHPDVPADVKDVKAILDLIVKRNNLNTVTMPAISQTFTGSGTVNTFALERYTSNKNTLYIYINGIKQANDTFELSSDGMSVIFKQSPAVGTTVEVMQLASLLEYDYSPVVVSYTGDGTTNEFSFDVDILNPASLMVNINDFILQQHEYEVLSDGRTVRIKETPPNGASIQMQTINKTSFITVSPNSIGEVELKQFAVTTTKLADKSVTEPKLAEDAVTTGKIKDGSVVESKLGANAVTTGKIKDGNVTEAKLASDSVTTAKIKDGNVTEAKLATDSVTTAKIKDGSVTTAKIADLAVTTAKIADLAVTEDKLAANAVTSGKIKDGAVTNTKIADGSITADKLQSNSVSTTKIRDGNVTEAKLATDSVTTNKIKDGNITEDKLDSALLTKINTGSVLLDEKTIQRNSDQELEIIGTIEKNKSSYKYDWVGTLAEWTAQNIATTHPDWVCYVTDDYKVEEVFPTQTGNSGKFLTTNGTNTSWKAVLPAQSENSGKFLTTNGSETSWADAGIVNIKYY